MVVIDVILMFPIPNKWIAPQGKHKRQDKSYYCGFTKYLDPNYKGKPLVAQYPKNILTKETIK